MILRKLRDHMWDLRRVMKNISWENLEFWQNPKKTHKCGNTYLGNFGDSIMKSTPLQLFLKDFAYF